MVFFNDIKINREIMGYMARKLICLDDAAFNKLQFSYLITNKSNPSNFSIMSNYPESWVKEYTKNRYHIIDPVIIAAKDKVSPFSWSDNAVIKIKSKKSEVFDLAREHNITHGYTFVLHDNEYNQSTLSFNCADDHYQVFFNDVIEEHKPKIQMLLISAHEKMLSLYKRNGDASECRHCLITQRENEILYWASLGKTYAEIASILTIKKNTVKYHMSNIIKKWDVLNAKHAIRLGIELNMIRPVQ